MFTGIVTAIGTVQTVLDQGDRILRIAVDWECADIPIGASISHSGICLTVTATSDRNFEVAASAETMRVTTLGGGTKDTWSIWNVPFVLGMSLAGISCPVMLTGLRPCNPSSRSVTVIVSGFVHPSHLPAL